jgi:uncharacterized protein
MESQQLLFLAAIAAVSFALSFYGAAVGLVLGHLRLPLLIYYLPSTAAGMATNLAISGAGALTGSVRHARAGRVSLRLLALMGIPSLAGAGLGALFLLKVNSSWVRAAIGLFLIFSGANLAFARLAADKEVGTFRGVRLFTEALIGLAIGFLASLTGLMLGSLRLPMMIRLLKVDPAEAVGTNMAIGCLTALFAAITLWPRGESFPLLPLLIVVPPTILGGYLGAQFTERFRKEALQRLVGLTIVLMGVGMAAEGAWKTLSL